MPKVLSAYGKVVVFVQGQQSAGEQLVRVLNGSDIIPMEVEYGGQVSGEDDMDSICGSIEEGIAGQGYAGMILWDPRRSFLWMWTTSSPMSMIVVRNYDAPETLAKLEEWMRLVAVFAESRRLKVFRFDENTDGVALDDWEMAKARQKFGWQFLGCGYEVLRRYMDRWSDPLLYPYTHELEERYGFSFAGNGYEVGEELKRQFRIRLAIGEFLRERDAEVFTTAFEKPCRFAAQRLMEDGFGYAPEEDWKTAVLLRLAKVAMRGLDGASSPVRLGFCEDGNAWIVGDNVSEMCPSIASSVPHIEVGIEPSLVFPVNFESAVVVCLTTGNGDFRIIASRVNVAGETPSVSDANALLVLKPNNEDATKLWVGSGGSSHAVITTTLDMCFWKGLATMLGCGFVSI